MDASNWLVLSILGAAVFLFIWDRIRVDVVALLVLVTLVLTGLQTPQEAFLGFASPAVVTVWAVFIISGGLYRSGVADELAKIILRVAGNTQRRLLIVIMLAVGGMSAFMNNIGAVAILMPAVISICRKVKLPPSKMLMPLGFAALLGGNMTLIGTPPNILAANILEDYAQVETFAFFDFFPVGAMSLLVGVIYMTFIGWHLLPSRMPMGGDVSTPFPVHDYVTEMRIRPNSPLLGNTVTEADLHARYGLNVLQVRHHGQELDPESNYQLKEGDVLLVEGSLEKIKLASAHKDLRLLMNWSHHEEEEPQNLEFAELAMSPNSRRDGQSLRQMDFRNRYGLSVLAMRQKGEAYTADFGDRPLHAGDELLVQGGSERLHALYENPNFLVLDTAPEDVKRRGKIPYVLAILTAVLTVITLAWIDAATGMLIGALAMVLVGAITMEEAYEAIDWQAVFLIAGLLPLGAAMESTGTATLMANQIVAFVGTMGPLAVLGGVFVLTSVLTSVISNAATTVLMVPIAIDAANNLGASPQAFVMAAVLAASTSFVTPVGHQVNVIIYSPGGYRFVDYIKVGLGLNLLVLLVALFFLPLVWPLF